jgi:hypothetical protein
MENTYSLKIVAQTSATTKKNPVIALVFIYSSSSPKESIKAKASTECS